ncbi:MAG: hypothetical protein ACERKD_11975 [Prolixibacteraceae bacterium]
MYYQKSEIIEQIQSYHQKVAELFYTLLETIQDEKIKSIVYDLYQLELSRAKYLEKHKNIAKALNCWLDFPCEKLSSQINECFKEIKTDQKYILEDVLKIEMHFDNCLIKLYNLLASENELSGTIANIFYYMHKKTKKEESMISEMMCNSQSNLNYNFSV